MAGEAANCSFSLPEDMCARLQKEPGEGENEEWLKTTELRGFHAGAVVTLLRLQGIQRPLIPNLGAPPPYSP